MLMLTALSALVLNLVSPVHAAVTPEDEFKGKPSPAQLTFSGMAGLGILDSTAGFQVLGSAATKLVNRGFIPDINNQVFLEFQFGPLFVASSTAWFYSAHLRW